MLLLQPTGVTATEYAKLPLVFLFSVRNRPLHMLATACETVSGFIYLYNMEMERVDTAGSVLSMFSIQSSANTDAIATVSEACRWSHEVRQDEKLQVNFPKAMVPAA